MKTVGEIEYANFNNLLLVNYHHKVASELLENKFIVYDIELNKPVMSEILNSAVNSYVPDSFFVYEKFPYSVERKKRSNCL